MEGKSSTPPIKTGKMEQSAVPVKVIQEPKTKADSINEIGGLASKLMQQAGNAGAQSMNPQYANSQQSLFAPATVNFTPAQIAASQPRRPYA